MLPPRTRNLLLATCGLLAISKLAGDLAAGASAAPVDYAAIGREAVQAREGVVRDVARHRDIPYTLYRPAALSGRHPIVLFSHGNGGTRQDGRYLAEHLASHGYVVVQVQHAGSDAAIWSGLTKTDDVIARMKAAAGDRRVHEQRYRDIPAVLDELAVLDGKDRELSGHLDLHAVGLSGHSWGALTTLVLIGARDGLDAPSYKDPRIKAAIALSPSLPRTAANEMKEACKEIAVPVLHVTGTLDSSPVVAGLDYRKRLGPYEAIAAPGQHLLILNGADHMLFPGADSPLRTINAADEPILRAVKAVSLAFWDAYLRNDRGARDWLVNIYPHSGDPVVQSMLSRAH
jgi:predicted dienelactone hydrolase